MPDFKDLFNIWWKNLDPNEIKDFINEKASRLINSFKDLFDWIEVDSLLEKLWAVINKNEPKLYQWEILFIRLIKEVLTNIILNKIGRLNDFILHLSSKWFEYLISRTNQYLNTLPENFCTLLYTMAPVSDEPAFKAQINRLNRIYTEKSLMNTFDSAESDIVDIIESFENNYINHYALFLSRCKYLGDEWGKHEGKIYGNKLQLIFQLKENNNRTPPDIVKNTLIELIHIRNAPSHKDTCGIIPVDDNNIRIRDRTHNGTLSYDKTFPKEDLWKFYYKLIILDRGIDIFALYLDLFFHLRKHNAKYVIILNCSCGQLSKVYFPPHITEIVCENCLKIHTRENLRVDGRIAIK
ncbi:MAG: hypothetical protein P8Y70_17915 [Candidatus Lokiarchaeota archaeon]